jgi:hypothetical protein
MSPQKLSMRLEEFLVETIWSSVLHTERQGTEKCVSFIE